jgi:hypothetical protein
VIALVAVLSNFQHSATVGRSSQVAPREHDTSLGVQDHGIARGWQWKGRELDLVEVGRGMWMQLHKVVCSLGPLVRLPRFAKGGSATTMLAV